MHISNKAYDNMKVIILSYNIDNILEDIYFISGCVLKKK